jgi:hypothetical protein
MGADASQFVDRTVIITNAHGKHVQANGASFSHSTNEAGWEQWKIEAADRSGDGKVTHVYLHNAAHDIRLSASDNKHDVGVSKNRAGWEKWQLEAVGDKWLIKSAHGTQLSQNDSGALSQSANKAGWEQFSIRIHGAPVIPHSPSGKFYLTNAGHGKQISFNDNHTLGFSPNKAGWEQVRLEEVSGKVVIGGPHGRNFSIDGERVQLSPNKAGWEHFTIQPVAGDASKYYLVAHTGNHLGHNGSEFYCNNKNTGSWEQWTLTAA